MHSSITGKDMQFLANFIFSCQEAALLNNIIIITTAHYTDFSKFAYIYLACAFSLFQHTVLNILMHRCRLGKCVESVRKAFGKYDVFCLSLAEGSHNL